MPEKRDFTVCVTVSKTYRLSVEAETEEEAESIVTAMPSTEIAESGSLANVEVDNIEVV